MTQIFISHSKNDLDLRTFFANAFASTTVKAVFEEFEKILCGEVTAAKINQDIENSNAVFAILSQNVQNIPHTRDWVVWESGVAKNKDIWIFEPYSQLGSISVIIPHLNHYVIFDNNDGWLGYVKKIIESYDNTFTLGKILLSGATGVGAGSVLAEEDKTAGVIIGGIAGLIGGVGIAALTDKSNERPIGDKIMCAQCHSSFTIHIPSNSNTFRCPVCNTAWQLKNNV